MSAMPAVRPQVPHFSSGPCAKRPGWTLQALKDAFLGRSHRAKGGKAKLKRAIEETRAVLAKMDGQARLMAQLLYGCGLRLMECVRLQVKDVDFERCEIILRESKGFKER